MRLLPNVDKLVVGILRAAMPAATVETEWSNGFTRTPYVLVDVTGGDELHPEFLGRPLVDIETYAVGSNSAAADLAENARVALYLAWRDQTVWPGGHLNSFRTVTYPHAQRLVGQPPNIFRYVATYLIGVRPPSR